MRSFPHNLSVRPPLSAGVFFGVAASLLLLTACDDPKKDAAAAASSASAVAAAPAPPPKPKTMPELLVDPEGPYIDGSRIDLTAKDGAERLKTKLAGLPIDGKPVTLRAEKKAKTTDVAAVVAAVGEAGAPSVTILTDGRDDVPKQIVVTPASRVSSPPGCSMTAMVLKDLSTAIWPIQGAVAKQHKKGFAGPDLSHTGESMKKHLAGCDSSMAFFSGDDSLLWEMTYNLAGTLVTVDEKKKLDTLVLLRASPTAGRPVTVGK